jgi:hypothetical protein
MLPYNPSVDGETQSTPRQSRRNSYGVLKGVENRDTLL